MQAPWTLKSWCVHEVAMDTPWTLHGPSIPAAVHAAVHDALWHLHETVGDISIVPRIQDVHARPGATARL